jgi:hypothetical protein
MYGIPGAAVPFSTAPGRELLWLSIGNLFYYLAGFFLAAALKEAIAFWERPAIFNTDQGSQFTSAAFVEVLWGNGISHQHWTASIAAWITSTSSDLDAR